MPCNIITHKREIPERTHICSRNEAVSEFGSHCEKFPIYGGFGEVQLIGVFITPEYGVNCLVLLAELKSFPSFRLQTSCRNANSR